MTREGQFIEADGRVCVGGEWLDLHPATEPDPADPAVVWAQFRWRHRYLNRYADSYPSDPSSPNQAADRPYGWL